MAPAWCWDLPLLRWKPTIGRKAGNISCSSWRKGLREACPGYMWWICAGSWRKETHPFSAENSRNCWQNGFPGENRAFYFWTGEDMPALFPVDPAAMWWNAHIVMCPFRSIQAGGWCVTIAAIRRECRKYAPSAAPGISAVSAPALSRWRKGWGSCFPACGHCAWMRIPQGPKAAMRKFYPLFQTGRQMCLSVPRWS